MEVALPWSLQAYRGDPKAKLTVNSDGGSVGGRDPRRMVSEVGAILRVAGSCLRQIWRPHSPLEPPCRPALSMPALLVSLTPGSLL